MKGNHREVGEGGLVMLGVAGALRGEGDGVVEKVRGENKEVKIE